MGKEEEKRLKFDCSAVTKISNDEQKEYVSRFLCVVNLRVGLGLLYKHQHDVDFTMQHKTYNYRRWEGSVVIYCY